MSRLFWKNFFSILLVVVAAAQWVCTVWLMRGLAGIVVPGWTNIAGPLILYVFNRALLSRPMPPSGTALGARRTYSAIAFSSVFGLIFLGLTAALSGLAWTGLWAAGLGDGVLAANLPRTIEKLGTLGLLTVGGAMAYGYGLGQRRLWINRFSVEIPGLPPALDGLQVAQISDVHLGAFMDAEKMRLYVARVNALNPDVTVITGDITDGLQHASQTFPALSGLRARLGVFAILGNHDVATGAAQVIEALRRHTEFRVLDDDVAAVGDGDARLYLIGLMDRGRDWARGLPACHELSELHASIPTGSPAILLSHRPDLFRHAARLGIALTLAGHTHGGQLAIPFAKGRVATLARFITAYPRGTFQDGSSVLHVNLGLGMTGQPVRLATPREITLITLERAQGTRCGTIPS